MADGLNKVMVLGKENNHPRLDVLVGRWFGRLLVIERSENSKEGKPMWLCVCLCGAQKPIRAVSLRNGTATSCGCFAREETVARSKTHGMTNSREWETWHRMKQRCFDPSCHNYPHYGGRGIVVCDRWVDSFQNFYDDMGPRPGSGFSIDRIDVNGNYEPGNCRWASIQQQASNKTNNVWIEKDGERKTAAEWSRLAGISQTTINDRLKRGETPQDAVKSKSEFRKRTQCQD